MMTQTQLEERLLAVETALKDLPCRLATLPPALNCLNEMIGSYKDEPAFAEVVALGRAFRESQPYPDDPGAWWEAPRRAIRSGPPTRPLVPSTALPGQRPAGDWSSVPGARHLDIHAHTQATQPAPQGDDTMGKVLEVPEETYDQLADLAQRQQRPVEEMLRLCLMAYEEILYERAHQQMVADGVLVSLPAPPLLPGETEEDDDFEPVELPGTPLSEIILEDRR